MEILIQFWLIYSVCLGVLGYRGYKFDPKESIEFLDKLGYKLGAPVRDYLSKEFMKFPNIVQE